MHKCNGNVARDVGGICGLRPGNFGGNDSRDVRRRGCGLYTRRRADAGRCDIAELCLDAELGLNA